MDFTPLYRCEGYTIPCTFSDLDTCRIRKMKATPHKMRDLCTSSGGTWAECLACPGPTVIATRKVRLVKNPEKSKVRWIPSSPSWLGGHKPPSKPERGT